jgi:hypothetical protein
MTLGQYDRCMTDDLIVKQSTDVEEKKSVELKVRLDTQAAMVYVSAKNPIEAELPVRITIFATRLFRTDSIPLVQKLNPGPDWQAIANIHLNTMTHDPSGELWEKDLAISVVPAFEGIEPAQFRSPAKDIERI